MGEVMNNEQVMRLMADIGLHEGGMDNWVLDNAWVKFANLVAAQEREAAITAIQNIERKGGWVTREDAINAIKARGTT
jgi:hypothetical protein